ncbi:MAG: hypothetical protein CMO81_08255 [Waddliaceae bacterium]|nr:hypothetical protein [Waddliaceae bacterium]
MFKQSFFLSLFISIFSLVNTYADSFDYASEPWWDLFWESSEGWGAPNARVESLIEVIDGTKEELCIVDIGSGNGRNSILALLHHFQNKTPLSDYKVYCIDYSASALEGLHQLCLPDWLKLETEKVDVNILDEQSLPKADLVLIYGILEYVDEDRLFYTLDLASKALYEDGYLAVVSLVNGEGALEIEGEITRPAEIYTLLLQSVKTLHFIDQPTVSLQKDCHDIGNGFPEDHLHYVYRTVMIKNMGEV